MSERDLWHSAAVLLRRRAQWDHTSGLSRDRGIAVIAEAMQRQQRRRTARRAFAFGIPTAAAAAVAALWLHAHDDSASRTAAVAKASPIGSQCRDCDSPQAPVDMAVSNGASVVPGGKFETTPDEPTEFTLVSGSRLRIAGGSSVEYVQGDSIHRFALNRGHAQFSVTKQRANERFLVNTPDAEVEVHGTVFEVALNDQSDGCGHRTAVTVSEGIVEVRTGERRQFVNAGSHWPEDCGIVSPKPRAPAPRAGARNGALVSVTQPAASEATPILLAEPARTPMQGQPVEAARASSLAQQNDLFARATSALQRGDYSRAIALYDELDTKFPNGPLAASAASARLRARELARRAP